MYIIHYNEKQWVSDFAQNNLLPSKAYRENGKYQVFRSEDGWHWKHVWTSPVDWYDQKSFWHPWGDHRHAGIDIYHTYSTQE